MAPKSFLMKRKLLLPFISIAETSQNDHDKNAPFSLWKANAEIQYCSILDCERSMVDSRDPNGFNPFDGVKKISYKGYIYHLNRAKKVIGLEKTRTYYFRCSNRKCGSSLVITVDPTSSRYDISANSHEHDSNCKKIVMDDQSITSAMIRCRAFAIELARNNQNIDPRTLVDLVLREIEIYNCEHTEIPLPFVDPDKIREWLRIPKPITTKELALSYVPPEIRYRQKQWVVADLTTKTRIIILSSIKMSNISNAISRLLLDGTFDITPPNFAQVINGIGYSYESQCFVPLFHILLQNKEAETYFDAIKLLFNYINFERLKAINFDFEPALILAIKSFFTEESHIHLHGCYFHYCQAIERKFEAIYGKTELREYLIVFRVVPFLDDLDYADFIEYMKNVSLIKDFMRYFLDQWGPNGRINREYWRYSEYEKTDDIITNDGAENFNGQYNVDIGKQPSLCTLLMKLYDFDDSFFRINTHKTMTQRSVNNRYKHLSKKEAKAEIFKYFPNVWPKKPKPIYKSKEINCIQHNTAVSEELLLRNNSFLPLIPKMITSCPKKHARKAGAKTKGLRKRNLDNTKERKILNELARNEKNVRNMEKSNESEVDEGNIEEFSEENENDNQENESMKGESDESDESDENSSEVSNINIFSRLRDRKRIVVYADRENSEEEESDSS